MMIRKIMFGMWLATSAVGLAQLHPAVAMELSTDGSFVGTVDPQVAAAFSEFPNGGPKLAAAVRALVTANPALVVDVVYLARQGSAAVKSSVAAGLAQAQAQLVASNPNAASFVASVVNLAGEEFQAAYVAVQSSSLSSGAPPPTLNSSSQGGSFGGGAVSPNRAQFTPPGPPSARPPR